VEAFEVNTNDFLKERKDNNFYNKLKATIDYEN
jgi:hypothetical protein